MLPNGQIVRSIVNVLAYRCETDDEALIMEEHIDHEGLEWFLRDWLGLADSPSLIAKIVQASKEEQL